jgi:hypothetical protein
MRKQAVNFFFPGAVCVPYSAIAEYDSLDAREVIDQNSSAGLAGEAGELA